MTPRPIKAGIMIKTACLLLAWLLAAACLFPCCAAKNGIKNDKRTAVFFDYFDTAVTLTAYADAEVFTEMKEDTERALERYHRLFDVYNEYEGLVNLAAINRMAGETVETDPDITALLVLGKEYEKLTKGSVNIFMGAVLLLWHERREAALNDPENASLPDKYELAEASLHCSPDDAEIDALKNTVTLKDPLMRIDAGAIAKGYAADRIAELLNAYGVPFMLNCGGAVLTNGEKPDGAPWVAGIEDPSGGEAFVGRANVVSAALSSSGAYLRYFTVGGERYGHIIDPSTNMPPEKLLSVSVLIGGEGCAALADALSTACFILGEEEGRRMIESTDGASALFVLLSGETEVLGVPGVIAD